MVYTADFIEDATTKIIHFVHKGRKYTCSNYETPSNGIHLCGQHINGTEPATVAVYKMDGEEARRLFNIAKAISSVEDGEDDFIVDLCVEDSIVEDFHSNRQLWPLAIQAWNREAAPDQHASERGE